MEDLSKRCFFCMGRKDEQNGCPYCSGAQGVSQEPGLLPLGSVVAGRYYMGKARKKNSEGVTYIAFDIKEGRKCSVREFFPEELAVRDADGLSVTPASGNENTFNDCMGDFSELWTKLMRLRGLSSLISVYDVFSENNTAYAVYEETEDRSLRDYLISNGVGYISWEQARVLFMPVLSTVGTLHNAGVIHRGMEPDSFIMTQDEKLKLSGFSIAKARLCYGDLDADVAQGYAPIEIYSEKYAVGPWTDVYAFTAVLYRALIGSTPIPAPVRAENDQMMIPAKFAEQLPPYVINAVINGMQIEPGGRTENMEQLRSNLAATPRAVNASAGIYGGKPASAPERPAPRTNNVYNPGVRRDRQQLIDPPSDYERPPQRPEPPSRQKPEAAQKPVYHNGLSPSAEQLLREQTQKAKSRKTMIIVLCCLLALALIGLVIFIVGVEEDRRKGNQNETTTVLENLSMPDFTGALYNTVAADSFYSQFFHFVKVEEYNATVQKGQILSQSVPVNTQVSKGTEVILYISAGPKMVNVPDVTGKTYEEALAILSQQGLICERATKYNDGTRAPDTVAETFPESGSQMKQGEQITVILWGAIEETTVYVPPAENATVYAGESSQSSSSGLSSLIDGIFN